MLQNGGIHAVRSQRNGTVVYLIALVNLGKLAVGGVFDGVCFFKSKELYDQPVKVFGPRPDNDLLRRYIHIAECFQVAADS